MENIFLEIGTIIIVATFFGYFSKMIKQPLIPAYILAGLFLGPMYGLITSSNVITTLSEIGMAFLLFIVGLEIDLRQMKEVAKAALVGGSIQIILFFTFGFVIASFFGIFTLIEAIYIGLILAFSSTMVVMKILSDKKQVGTLHGRIIIGILLVQDLFAIIALSSLSTLSDFSLFLLFAAVIKGLFIFTVAMILIKYVLPPIYRVAAKSQELLFLVSLSVCFFFSFIALYVGKIIIVFVDTPIFEALLSPQSIRLLQPGFSIIIGAFVAGICLANLPYNLEIIGKIKPLKDFFATIFFVSLGLELSLGSIVHILVPTIFFIAFVIIIKPFVIMLTTCAFGYMKRPAFMTAISLGQISEFSLIIVAQGILLGQISQGLFSLTVLLAIITIITTTYFINYEQRAYQFLGGFLKMFDYVGPKKNQDILEYLPKDLGKDAILFGYDRIGYNIVKKLKNMKKTYLVVDYNPEVIKHLIRQEVPCIYGDVGDLEILERVDLANSDMIISTVPEDKENLLLIKKTKEVNERAIIFVTAERVGDALKLYEAGADYVILPHFLGAERVAVLLEDFEGDLNKVLDYKLNHIKELHERRNLGHEHPAKA